MSEQPSPILPGFIEPCLPCVAVLPPSGEGWLHEVKHSGQRLLARRDGESVYLFGRHGEDWTACSPQIIEAIRLLPVKSCAIDGQIVSRDQDGNTTPNPLPETTPDVTLVFYAFDLIEVNGFDLRREPIEERKRALAHLLREKSDMIRFNPHFEREGAAVLRQACRMGFEGIISKRRGSRYLSGRCTNWLLSKALD
jgi:bifunctional non-homologous end joining protein LigD